MNQNTLFNKTLDQAQTDLLSKLLTTLDKDQKIWLGGYLSGINESTEVLLQLLTQGKTLSTNTETATDTPVLKILFGTRSGNAQKLAQKAHKKASTLGVNSVLVNLNDYNPKEIKKEKNLLIIVSTDGEGEPPLSTEEFYNYILSKKAPKINDLKYSVLALGDSSYQHFCKTGVDIDNRLKELGANQVADRTDCDLDFDEDATNWIESSLSVFAEELKKQTPKTRVNTPNLEEVDSGYSQESPYKAALLDRIQISGRGSSKETIHYEFSIEDSGITYNPGDSLGVYSTNDSALVDKVLSLTKLNETDRIVVGKEEKTIREALTNNYEITRLTPPLIKSYAEIAQSKKLDKIISDNQSMEDYFWGRDFVDLIEEYPVSFDNKSLFTTLRKLQPRLYSIASSYNANPDEVHLTIASVKYNRNKRDHYGVCSTFLSDRINEDTDLVPIYIDENISFKLPKDNSTPIIMIGAGTGIAPYRAFLQERTLDSNSGNSWLFFGERNFATDFLYQTEWQKLKRNKVLTNIDLAFSRDQKNKIYVQHKLLQQKKELFKWIEEGAHIYVCGDKNAMAKDVKQALLSVIETEGGFKTDKAEEYFKQLRRENRFQEDVY